MQSGRDLPVATGAAALSTQIPGVGIYLFFYIQMLRLPWGVSSFFALIPQESSNTGSSHEVLDLFIWEGVTAALELPNTRSGVLMLSHPEGTHTHTHTRSDTLGT